MYWRVRSIKAGHVMRMYGVHLALGASLLVNFLLFTSRPLPAKKALDVYKKGFEQLARDVTTELLDSSYISYEKNTNALMAPLSGDGGLDPKLIQRMQQQDLLPKTADDLKARERDLADQKTVVSVRIDEVRQGDQADHGGITLVPMDVNGAVATHSASGADEKAFHLRLWMGLAATGQMTNSPDGNKYSRYSQSQNQQVEEKVPVVADVEDLSGQPMPQTPQPF